MAKFKQIVAEAMKSMPKRMQGNIVDGKALQPTGNMREIAQRERDKRFIVQANKKLKGFKFGQGVGP